MNKKTRQKLADLDRQIKQMKSAGNRAGEALGHTQKAMLYVASMEMGAAAKEMAKAGVLAQEEGRVDEMALVHLAQGKTMALEPGQRAKARELLENAVSLYHTMEDYEHEVEALKELAALEAAEQNFEPAVQRISKVIDKLDEEQQAPQVIELLTLRANYQVCLKNIDQALEDLDTAIELAGRTDHVEMGLTVRAQRQILQSVLEGGSTEALDAIRREAARAGQFDIAGDLQLQQANEALLAGRYEQAAHLAETVRRAAQQAKDLGRFVRYLAASVALAGAQESLNNRREVLYALLSCKAYLETHLGQAVGQEINQILDAYKERWGKQAMAGAIRDYQAWMQEMKQQQNGK